MNGILVVWCQYLPESIKWHFGNLGSIRSPDGQCSGNYFVNGSKTFFNLDRFEKNGQYDGGILIKLRNPEIDKAQANRVKTQKLETLLNIFGNSTFRIFEILEHYGTPQNADSHPTPPHPTPSQCRLLAIVLL